VSEQPPPTPRDPGGETPDPDAPENAGEPYEAAAAPRPPHRPHRPAKPPEPIEPPEPSQPWYEAADGPHHTGDGTYSPAGTYFTPNPPDVPYFPAAAPAPRLDRTTALVAALVLTALVAMSGWITAALALTRDAGPARAAAQPSRTAGGPTASPAAPLSLAEAPCGPAATLARRQGLTEVRSTPSATLDGSGTELRLKLRCAVSTEEFDLSVDLLRSPDAEAVDEFFEFHRRSAVGGDGGRPLDGLGDRAYVTVDGAAVSGRTTIGVDVAGNHRAMAIVGTTSGPYASTDARALLVAIARAYLTAR
jgi:hypothetical protein